MVHRGRLYETEFRARLYSGDAFWGAWPAKRYDILGGFNANFEDHYISLHANNVELYTETPADGVIEWRAPCESWDGHDMELALVFDVVLNNRLWCFYGQLYMDGVPQITPYANPMQDHGCQIMTDQITTPRIFWPPILPGSICTINAVCKHWGT